MGTENQAYKRLEKCFECFKSKVNFKPQIAVVLGSGLGDFAETIKIEAILNYSDIESFPVSTVPGHKGRFVFGYVKDVPVVIMQGRVHYYEGYSMEDVVLPIRLMKMMGAKTILLTNAAGGINKNFKPGNFMLITDHINMAPCPLIGKNLDKLGPRFPDMSCIYDNISRQVVKATADTLNIPLQEGVYLQLTGPAYETPAEIRMAATIGADAVGMSTACEAVVANHCGMKVVGISCISNLASGISPYPLSHQEVQETADRAAPLFKELVKYSIINLSK